MPTNPYETLQNGKRRNVGMATRYESPKIERKIAPADLEKEFAYAGSPSKAIPG